MIIANNISAMTSYRGLLDSSNRLSQSLSRLSLGTKLVNAEDDAGDLSVTMQFDAYVSRVDAVRHNVINAHSFSQTQEGYLRKVQKALDRMGELGELALDATKTADELEAYDKEYQTLASFVSMIAEKDFNGISLFDPTTNELVVTTDDDPAFDYTFGTVDLTAASSYNAALTGNLLTSTDAQTALADVKDALVQLGIDIGTVAANNSRLNFESDKLVMVKEMFTSASSRMKDVDVAAESTEFAKTNILVQAGTAMLAQANVIPQSALRLLS